MSHSSVSFKTLLHTPTPVKTVHLSEPISHSKRLPARLDRHRRERTTERNPTAREEPHPRPESTRPRRRKREGRARAFAPFFRNTRDAIFRRR